MLKIDLYANTNPISNYRQDIKVALPLLILIISIVLEKTLLYVVITSIFIILDIFMLKIPLKYLFKLYIAPFVFIMLSMVGVIIRINVETYIYSINLLGIDIGITTESLGMSLGILLRAFSTVSIVYFISLSTSINQILVLLKRMKAPSEVVEITMLIYRYIFLLLDEGKELVDAMVLRGGFDGIRNSFRSTGILIKEIFINVLNKYEKQKIGLIIKNFDGTFHIK